MMNAKVTIEFIVNNVCNPEDLVDTTFEELVRWLIREEGIHGIAEDDYKVIKIERIYEE